MCLLAALASPAAAQGIGGSPFGNSGRFGERLPTDSGEGSEELSVRFDIGGGFDDDISAEIGPQLEPVGDRAATAAGALRYRRGRTTRNFDISGRGFFNYRSAAEDQVKGWDTNIQAATNLGRRSGLAARGGVAYQPTVLFRGVGTAPVQPEGPAVETPDLATPQGVLDQTWLIANGGVGLYHNWTARHRMDLGYDFTQTEPLEGSGFPAMYQSLSLQHLWSVRRALGFTFSYRLDDTRQDDPNIVPLRLHSGALGLRIEKRLSPSRSIRFSGTGGVTQTTAPASSADRSETLVPTGLVSAQFDFTRWLTANIEASRYVTALDSLTLDPFTTDTGSVRLGGLLSERLALWLVGTMSRGSAVVGEVGSFRTAMIAAQSHFALSRCCSVFANYTYYEHRLRDIGSLPGGFPQGYDRNSVRVGVTLWQPLYRRY